MNKQEILKLAEEFAAGDAAAVELKKIRDFLQDNCPGEFSAVKDDESTFTHVLSVITNLQDKLDIANAVPPKAEEI